MSKCVPELEPRVGSSCDSVVIVVVVQVIASLVSLTLKDLMRLFD